MTEFGDLMPLNLDNTATVVPYPGRNVSEVRSAWLVVVEVANSPHSLLWDCTIRRCVAIHIR
jgi:hypothetical protein